MIVCCDVSAQAAWSPLTSRRALLTCAASLMLLSVVFEPSGGCVDLLWHCQVMEAVSVVTSQVLSIFVVKVLPVRTMPIARSLARATHCRSGHLCSCVMSCVAPTGTKVFINHEMAASEFLRPFVGCTRSFVHYALCVLHAMHWLHLLCVHSRSCPVALLYVYHISFCCPHARSSASRLFIARLVDSLAVC